MNTHSHIQFLRSAHNRKGRDRITMTTNWLRRLVPLLPAYLFFSMTTPGDAVAQTNAPWPDFVGTYGQGGYEVWASGDLSGVKDADNIEWALNNVAPRGKVYLSTAYDPSFPGTTKYHVSRAIIVKPEEDAAGNYVPKTGFDGALIGAGKDETVVEAVRGPAGAPFEYNFRTKYFPAGLHGFIPLLHFEWAQDISVSDLTLRVKDPSPSDPHTAEGVLTTMLDQLLSAYGGDFKAMLRNVRFEGSAGDFYGRNSGWGVHLMPGEEWDPSWPSGRYGLGGTGNLSIRNCDFDGTRDGAYMMWYVNSVITIGGSPDKKNTFNVSGNGLWFGYTTDFSNVNISHNEFVGYRFAAIDVLQTQRGAVWPESSTFVFKHNRLTGVGKGIRVVDFRKLLQGVSSASVVVADNVIHRTGNKDWRNPAVFAVFTEGMMVTNNTISGDGPAGITDRGVGSQLIGNNLRGFIPTGSLPPANPPAHIYLEGLSTDAKVVGNEDDIVFDAGTNSQIVATQRFYGHDDNPVFDVDIAPLGIRWLAAGQNPLEAASKEKISSQNIDSDLGEAPDAYALAPSYPNPANPSTNIAFTLPRTEAATLEIFNATGRKIRTLVHGEQRAGTHTVTWDGRDDLGRDVSSGVYFYRLVSPGLVQTNKMALLK